MSANAVLIASLAVINIPVYYLAYRALFRDVQEFIDAIWFWLKPDIWSWMDGEYWDDRWAEMKLCVFAGASSGAVMLEAYLVSVYVLGR